jgi:DNA-binding SARP family transcriptional activator
MQRQIAQGDTGPLRLSRGAAMFRLTTFGKPALTFGGAEVPIVNRKSMALCAYLANTTHGSESRERLAGLLWSESTEERARASLRQTISDLKTCMAVQANSPFAADRLNVSLRMSDVDVDLRSIRETLRSGSIDPVLLDRKRLSENFLAGFEDLDPAFRAWLMVQRQCIHNEFVGTLEGMAAGETDMTRLKRAGLALLNLDPTHETGCRAAMEASARLGDSAGALRLYKSLWDILDEEFDSEPSEKTQDLVFEIKMGQVGPSRDTGVVDTWGQGGERGAAALNLVAIPGPQPQPQPQQSQAFFLFVGEFEATGVTTAAASASVRILRREIVASLVRFRDWAVLDLDGKLPPDVRRPAYLIEATAFEERDSLRFILTLKDTSNGRYIWSEQVSIEAADWFQTQQRIIRRIAIALDVSMSSESLTRISGIPDLSLDQFDKWLKGQELIFRWRPQDEAKAEALFRSIITEAPHFAPAYSGVAGILNSRHLIFPGIFRTPENHVEALRLAKMAVQIDPIDSRTQLHLAWSYAMNGIPDRAGLNFLLACELNPNDPWTLVSASLGLAYCDDFDNAERLSRMALDIGLGVSKLHWSYQAGVRFIFDDYSGCIEAADQAEDVVFYIRAWKAAACALLGNIEAARFEAQAFLALVRANWFAAGKPDDAEITQWLLHCFPIVNAGVAASLRRGLALAGLPVPPDSHRSLGKRQSAAAPDRVVSDA